MIVQAILMNKIADFRRYNRLVEKMNFNVLKHLPLIRSAIDQFVFPTHGVCKNFLKIQFIILV